MTPPRAVLDRIRDVLVNTYSDFYRHKYSMNAFVHEPVALEACWDQLPFLTREEIQAAPLLRRLHVAQKDVETIRPTSGTSGTGILLVPRSGGETDFAARLHRELYMKHRVKRLATMSGAHFRHEETFRMHVGVRSIAVDMAHKVLASTMIASFQTDMLAGFAYGIEGIAPFLVANGSAQKIRVVEVFGEWCSSLYWTLLHEQFPNATIVSTYSSIEIQRSAGVACEKIMQAHEQYIHIAPEYAYGEIVDTDTGSVIEDENIPGELVLTMLHDDAFPMIRYRTGDLARIVRRECGCGTKTPVLAIEGRVKADRIRILGGEINSAEIDRVLLNLNISETSVDFEAVYSEEFDVGLNRALPRLELHFAWDKGMITASDIALKIAHHLRVAPDRTYADGVVERQYLPLRAVYKADFGGGGKRNHLVRKTHVTL